MKVLVFGSSGFIGSHLASRLRVFGHTVLGYDRAVHENTTICADIRNREAVHSAMLLCDRWVNLAGLLGTSELVHRAHDAVDVNIGGALNVYEAARITKKPGVQITVGNHWMDNAYSITKSAAERFALMYQKDLGVDIRVLRAMNVYGPGQKAHPVRKLIPNLVIPALRNEDITIYGSGRQVMDMIHVVDACRGLMDLLFGAYSCRVRVSGSARPTTVNEILAEVLRLADSKSKVIHTDMRAGEESDAVVMAPRQWPDNQVTLEDGLKQVIACYRHEMETECQPA